MWIKAYVKFKDQISEPFDLYFKYGKVQEMNGYLSEGVFPFQNNSILADDIEIHKFHDSKTSPKDCKYFIKKSVNNEVMLLCLKINLWQYFKLQWQLKTYVIQSKEFKINLIISIISLVLGYLIGVNQ